jgi:hypothetical protein
VDVGPLVVPNAKPAKLIEPRKRALDDPPPLSQAAAMPRATHGHQRQNVTRPQAVRIQRLRVRAPSTFALASNEWDCVTMRPRQLAFKDELRRFHFHLDSFGALQRYEANTAAVPRCAA